MSRIQSTQAVLNLFAMLFSNRWIARWQNQQSPPEPPRQSGKKKAAQHRPNDVDFINASSRCG